MNLCNLTAKFSGEIMCFHRYQAINFFSPHSPPDLCNFTAFTAYLTKFCLKSLYSLQSVLLGFCLFCRVGDILEYAIN